MIDEAVKRHHLQARVILQSFDFRTLRAMKRWTHRFAAPRSSRSQVRLHDGHHRFG